VYAETLPIAERLYLTRIEREIPGDTFFPEFDEGAWSIVRREAHPEADLPHTFLVYERRNSRREEGR
ncbi:MAG: dihydrofolate reductase, partial [Deltaproteobacteria bacterium]